MAGALGGRLGATTEATVHELAFLASSAWLTQRIWLRLSLSLLMAVSLRRVLVGNTYGRWSSFDYKINEGEHVLFGPFIGFLFFFVELFPFFFALPFAAKGFHANALLQ